MAQSQNADGTQAVGQSRATIVGPLSLIKTDDMDFGRIAARPTAGTVTIDPVDSTCAVTGTIIHTGTCRPASFAGRGAPHLRARITLDTVVNLTGPGQAMVLDNIFVGTNSTISFSGNPNANGRGVGLTRGGNQRYSIASSTGIYVLHIGGRLNVNANQAPGVYTGSFTVTVQYQ